MLHKLTILLLLALAFNGVTVGQDIVFNMTGQFAVQGPNDAIPNPDVNDYDGASFEFEAVFEQDSQSFSASLGGPVGRWARALSRFVSAKLKLHCEFLERWLMA